MRPAVLMPLGGTMERAITMNERDGEGKKMKREG